MILQHVEHRGRAAVQGADRRRATPTPRRFRPFERVAPEHAGPPSVAYDVQFTDQRAAVAQVWSSGGYVSSTGQAMTHIGFEFHSTSSRPLAFDADALEFTLALGRARGAVAACARASHVGSYRYNARVALPCCLAASARRSERLP